MRKIEVSKSQFPGNVVRIMRPQLDQIRRTVAHHFKHRHDGRGSAAARNWIAEWRRVDAASGYSAALAAMAVNHA